MSCHECPQFLAAGDPAGEEVFGEKIDMPMCAMHGHVFSHPNEPQTPDVKVMEFFYEYCATPADERSEPNRDKIVPAMMVGKVVSIRPRKANPETIGSCDQCKHAIVTNAVVDKFGYPLPMCGGVGRLLTQDMRNTLPGSCGMAEAHDGKLSRNADNVELGGAYTQAPEPLVVVVEPEPEPVVVPTVVAPEFFESEADVSEEDAMFGIKAWREVATPAQATKPVRLPVFGDFVTDISEGDKLTIPRTGDAETPELYIDHQHLAHKLMVAHLTRQSMLLIGEAGTGKTEAARYMAWLMRLPFHRIPITKATLVDDLIGKPEFKNGETTFQDGRLLKIQQPGVIVIDEYNLGQNEVEELLRPLLDGSRSLTVDQDSGQTIKLHPWCFLVFTMNPSHDPRYIGANVQSAAGMDRVLATEVTRPPREIERQIVQGNCDRRGFDVDPKTLDTLLDIAAKIRLSVDAGDLQMSFGVRPVVKIATLLEFYSLREAFYQVVIGGKLDDDAAAIVDGIINPHVTLSDAAARTSEVF